MFTDLENSAPNFDSDNNKPLEKSETDHSFDYPEGAAGPSW